MTKTLQNWHIVIKQDNWRFSGMGIFDHVADKLRQNAEETSEGTAINNELKQVDIEFDPHIPVSILNNDGSTFNYRLIVIGVNEITLERMPGTLQLPLYSVGAEVSLLGYNDDMEVRQYTGIVKTSSYVKLVVSNIQKVKFNEKRTDTRQPINKEGTIEIKDRSVKCNIVDLSLGGARVICSNDLHRDDEIKLVINLGDNINIARLVGKVIRVNQKSDGNNDCALIFAQLTDKQSRILGKYILNTQNELKKALEAN